MAYKVFLSPTGSGNVIFEGDVINGMATPDVKKVKIQFFSNDRGYTAAAYYTDLAGAKALRQELQDLQADPRAEKPEKIEVDSRNKNFKLSREFEGTPLILFCNGQDKMQGRCFHRGNLETMKKLCAEFDTVLKTLDDVAAGKGPGVEA